MMIKLLNKKIKNEKCPSSKEFRLQIQKIIENLAGTTDIIFSLRRNKETSFIHHTDG